MILKSQSSCLSQFPECSSGYWPRQGGRAVLGGSWCWPRGPSWPRSGPEGTTSVLRPGSWEKHEHGGHQQLPHPGTSPAPARCRGRRGDCQWGPASQPRMDTQLNRLILRVTTSWVLSFLLRTNMLSAYFLHSPNTSQPQHFRVKSSVLLFQQKSK